MAAQPEPEIVLYDLACAKNVCFSPVVWHIRLLLNYKRVPYRTIFLEFPDIEPTLKGSFFFTQPENMSSVHVNSGKPILLWSKKGKPAAPIEESWPLPTHLSTSKNNNNSPKKSRK